MKRIAFLLVAVAGLAGLTASTAPASEGVDEEAAPIFGVKIPPWVAVLQMVLTLMEMYDKRAIA